jgi:hypothetical protein
MMSFMGKLVNIQWTVYYKPWNMLHSITLGKDRLHPCSAYSTTAILFVYYRSQINEFLFQIECVMRIYINNNAYFNLSCESRVIQMLGNDDDDDTIIMWIQR